ncbi:unnamed protein product [Fraxinus pennsylvanica]|uniref:MGS-like domain-containing protein n=1 Tax=Fraxinus pennsylvanica TaxID=56036 RepID=A0AAD1ZAT1_9LAMI|nr:unnamed protein product [Fraxinus pennsylvanica]
MLGFAAAPTAATSAASAVTSLANAAHSNIFSSAFFSLDSISGTFSPFNQPVSATSSKLTSYRVKAMADTLSTPKLDSKSSVAGRRQALISLSDKNDLALLGRGLQDLGFTIVSTGGTASALESSGVSVTKVEELTSFPEMFIGIRRRPSAFFFKPRAYSLSNDVYWINTKASGQISVYDVEKDVLYVCVYKLRDIVMNQQTTHSGMTVQSKVSSSSKISFEDGIENIDIGGPAMIRAAAKLPTNAYIENELFCWFISEWLWKQTGEDKFPPSLTVPLSLKSSLRYGENPHQKAAFYVDRSLSEVNAGGIATAIQHHGKEMSYNNYLDADAAWNCVCEFSKPTCVIVKHTNPCGVASRENIIEAYRLAVRADPVSAFGGIVAFNVEVDEAIAKDIREFRSPTDGETRMFYEIVVAPKYSKRGLEILRGKSKTLRILEATKNSKGKLSLRQVGGGWLAQDADDLTPEDIQFNVVSSKAPQESELSDAQFAWLCVKHVKSNAIVIAKNNCMLGMGSGQPNRLESLRIALRKAGNEVKGAALASDAFFPFGNYCPPKQKI